MCNKCEELDQKITRYRRFVTGLFDPLTDERITGLIEGLERQKENLHSAQRYAAIRREHS